MAKITVLKTAITKPIGKNYEICELAYRTEDNKTKGMKILSFVSPEPFKVASAANSGDILEAQFTQSDKGFWQFQSLTPTGTKEAAGEAKAHSAAAPSGTRGNWETSEERAARQVMIVRQSSLSNAVAFFASREPKGTTADAKGVVELAKFFEAYVLDKPVVTGEVE